MSGAKVKVFELGPSVAIAKSIIEHLLPNAVPEVKKAVGDYAMGNPGAARVLAEHAKDFKTAKEVESLVGWALDDHTLERTGDIWDRFKDEGKKQV